jgi:hypothetical protein
LENGVSGFDTIGTERNGETNETIGTVSPTPSVLNSSTKLRVVLNDWNDWNELFRYREPPTAATPASAERFLAAACGAAIGLGILPGLFD